MMKGIQYVGMFLIAANLISCSGSHKTDTTEQSESVEEKCTYSYQANSVNVQWTAFKTSEKIGVSGTFDTVNVDGLTNGNSVSDVFTTGTFSIPVGAVNSNNPERDLKIVEHFFGTMNNSGSISGRIVNINDTRCSVLIGMNGVQDTCLFSVNQNDTIISLEGVLQLASWNALESASVLNEVCYDLHKGGDGVSKLWPDVKLNISAVINKSCD